jgi:hypothetical protein
VRAWQTDVTAAPDGENTLALTFYKDKILPLEGLTVILHQQTAFDLAIAILEQSQTDLVKYRMARPGKRGKTTPALLAKMHEVE